MTDFIVALVILFLIVWGLGGMRTVAICLAVLVSMYVAMWVIVLFTLPFIAVTAAVIICAGVFLYFKGIAWRTAIVRVNYVLTAVSVVCITIFFAGMAGIGHLRGAFGFLFFYSPPLVLLIYMFLPTSDFSKYCREAEIVAFWINATLNLFSFAWILLCLSMHVFGGVYITPHWSVQSYVFACRLSCAVLMLQFLVIIYSHYMRGLAIVANAYASPAVGPVFTKSVVVNKTPI